MIRGERICDTGQILHVRLKDRYLHVVGCTFWHLLLALGEDAADTALCKWGLKQWVVHQMK
jgi:hypothetical protein